MWWSADPRFPDRQYHLPVCMLSVAMVAEGTVRSAEAEIVTDRPHRCSKTTLCPVAVLCLDMFFETPQTRVWLFFTRYKSLLFVLLCFVSTLRNNPANLLTLGVFRYLGASTRTDASLCNWKPLYTPLYIHHCNCCYSSQCFACDLFVSICHLATWLKWSIIVYIALVYSFHFRYYFKYL